MNYCLDKFAERSKPQRKNQIQTLEYIWSIYICRISNSLLKAESFQSFRSAEMNISILISTVVPRLQYVCILIK